MDETQNDTRKSSGAINWRIIELEKIIKKK